MSDNKPINKRLPQSIWILSWVSFFADVSSEMIYPLLPLFLVAVLGATKTQLGFMEGAAILIVSGLAAWSGWRSDRSRRRVPWMKWGYGLPVLGKALIAVATVWPWALAGRWLDRVGKGMRGAPRDALIADLVDLGHRGQAFGLHRAFDTAGALVGVLFAALLLWWFRGSPTGPADESTATPAVSANVYRVVIGVGAVLGLISWMLTWLVKDVADSSERTSTRREVAPRVSHPGAGALGLSHRYWRVLGVLALFGVANSSDAFLLLRASELGFSPWGVVLAFAVFNCSYALFSYPAGAWSDHVGRWRVIGTGWLIYVAVYAGMAGLSASSSGWVWVLMGFYGLYMALTEGVGKALIADCAPAQARGRALGIFQATMGLCGLLASVVVGLLWDSWNSSVALMFSALVAAVAMFAIVVLVVFEPRRA